MKDIITQLWEIKVPTHDNVGIEFPLAHHRQWDDEVLSLSGGLTIHRRAKGQWIDQDTGMLYREHMIPVEIACNEPTIRRIGELTLVHYDQEAVMITLLSEKVIFLER